MIPLNIALGPKAVCFMLDNYERRIKVEQHCVIYNNRLIEEYRKINTDIYDSFIEYIDAHEGEAGYSKNMGDKEGVIEPLEQVFARLCPKENKNFPSNIVILFEDENGREIKALGNKRSNILTSKEIINNRKNIFNMLSPNTESLDVEPMEDCIYWAEYFSRIIEGEKNVIFMNRYGLSEDGISCLKCYYLPILKQETRIQIYAAELYSEKTKDEIVDLFTQDPCFKDINIEIYLIQEPNKYHERWIQTENFYIYQGKGFTMLSINKSQKMNSSSTVIVERRKRSLPPALRVL